jgi:hypothetical protein
MAIDTGGSITSTLPLEGPAIGTTFVLFDSNSTYQQSPLVTVRPDYSVLLIGYGIPYGAAFTVEGVSLGSRAMGSYPAFAPERGVARNLSIPAPPPDILFRSPMRLGGNEWELTSDNDRMLISLPGDYLLVLNDPSYLGAVQVEAVWIPGHQQLPFSYMPGN